MSATLRCLALGLLLASVGCAEDLQLSTQSKEAAEAYEAGLQEMRRFRMPEAVAHFSAAVGADSTFAMAHLELSRCYSWVGRAAEVDQGMKRAYELRDGASEQERLQIEHSYAMHQRDKEAADAVFEELAERYPDDPYTLQLAARRSWREQDFELAARSFQRILEQDASRVDVHNLLGYLYLEAGEYEEAIQCFQRYVYYAPNLANPHDSLGDAYRATGQYDDAIAQYRASLEIDPSFLHSWAQLAGTLIATGQFEHASSILDKTEDLFVEMGQRPWRSFLQLLIHLGSEDWETLADQAQEIRDADYMHEMSGKNFALSAAAMRIIALLEMNELEQAELERKDFDKRLEKFVKHEEELEPMALPDVVRLVSASLDSRFARARGNPQAAVDGLAAALKASQQSPHELSEFRIELARARLAAGDPAAALAEIEVILRVIPTQPEANLRAAQILAELGRGEDVLRHLGIYLEVMRRADPGHPGLREAEMLAERYAMAN